MVSEAVAPQLQPFLAEMRRRFDEHDRRFDALAAAGVERDRRLHALSAAVAEHDRKLDVIVVRLDGMKVLGQVILGALALLIAALTRISHTHGRRKGSTRRGTTAGTAWNAGLRPARAGARNQHG